MELMLFLALMLGVGLGSAAAAWSLRLTAEEETALGWWTEYQSHPVLPPKEAAGTVSVRTLG